jgi:hypothetical protein
VREGVSGTHLGGGDRTQGGRVQDTGEQVAGHRGAGCRTQGSRG